MSIQRRKRGYTLVDLLVMLDIIGVMAALLLPAIQAAREAARRNTCRNNLRQMVLAIHQHAEHQLQFPLACTRPYRVNNTAARIVVHGRYTPSNPAAPNDPSDGFSWIVQIMPELGCGAIYDQMAENTNGFVDVPWYSLNTQDGTDNTNHICSTQIKQLQCPSFPGEHVALITDGSYGGVEFSLGGSRPAVCNYLALVATHFEAIPRGLLIDDQGTHAGNGAIVFPRVTGTGATARVTPYGLPFRAIRDGMAHTVALAETRETGYTTWLSGLATYGVGVWPGSEDQSDVAPGPGRADNGLFGWNPQEAENTMNRTSLNQGSDRSMNSELHYMEPNQHPHGARGRRWGPSSAHPGLVIHAYCDGHVEEIAEGIDKNTYIRLITRASENPGRPRDDVRPKTEMILSTQDAFN